MKDILPDLKRWQAEGAATDAPAALATIVETRGSSLRPAGTRMVINVAGEIAGSVSSGCVDGDVVAEMEALLQGGVVIRRPFIGVSDEQAWGAGLACGGALDVLVERWTPLHDRFAAQLEARQPVGFASRTDRPAHLLHTASGETHGTLGDPGLDAAVVADMLAAWPGPHAAKHTYPQAAEVFVEVVPPPITLLIFGATDIAVPLAQLGHTLGFRVIVSDARRAFLRPERFPNVELRFGWPQEVFTSAEMDAGWGVVVLFHDAKFDVPALSLALKSAAFYIGFLGSRGTQADRHASLLAARFTEADLARIHGPVGLNIGGREPGMIALSAIAEVVAVRHGCPGGMLSGSKG